MDTVHRLLHKEYQNSYSKRGHNSGECILELFYI